VSWGYSTHIDQHAGIAGITGTTQLERRLQWQGTRDIAAFLTVPAAIAFLVDIDWRGQARRCHGMALECGARVAELTGQAPICAPDDCAQMVAMPYPTGDTERLRSTLFERYRIEIPVTGHAARHFVRLSVFAYNTQDDVDKLVRALVELHGSREDTPSDVGATVSMP
jgi:isopenicillin-N epimerase